MERVSLQWLLFSALLRIITLPITSFVSGGRNITVSRKLSLPRESAPLMDVTLILQLHETPYMPLHESSSKNVTLKTRFLLALALVKQVGELLGLSVDVRWKLCSFAFAPECVAKIQNLNLPDSGDEFATNLIHGFVGNDQDEILLAWWELSCSMLAKCAFLGHL